LNGIWSGNESEGSRTGYATGWSGQSSFWIWTLRHDVHGQHLRGYSLENVFFQLGGHKHPYEPVNESGSDLRLDDRAGHGHGQHDLQQALLVFQSHPSHGHRTHRRGLFGKVGILILCESVFANGIGMVCERDFEESGTVRGSDLEFYRCGHREGVGCGSVFGWGGRIARL
jgi:hypothetical protein